MVARPPTRVQKEERRAKKAMKQQKKQQRKQPKASKAPTSIWDVNENEVDSDEDGEWRKKSVMQAMAQGKRKSYVNYDAPSDMTAPPKRGDNARQQFEDERRKSVFEESSSEEDSDDDEDMPGNGRRLTVNMTQLGQNHSISGHVNFTQ